MSKSGGKDLERRNTYANSDGGKNGGEERLKQGEKWRYWRKAAIDEKDERRKYGAMRQGERRRNSRWRDGTEAEEVEKMEKR